MPGFDWLKGFRNHNPVITLSRAEGLSLAHLSDLNKSDVAEYFPLL